MTLDEIHEAELYVLKRVDDICQKIGVKYWVLYGTLLGAVRNHGIIPWDDDIDIGMMRADYNKFIQYCIDEGDKLDGLHLDHALTRKNYPYYIARVSETRNSTSQCYESGLFVDIYPIDSIRVSEWNRWCNIVKLFRGTFFPSVKLFWGDNVKGRCLLIAGAALFKVVKRLLRNVQIRLLCLIDLKLIEFLARKYIIDPNSEYCGIACWCPDLTLWKKSIFTEAVRVEFEDFTVPVPAGYDEILRGLYGDYMQLPPPEKRKPHHNYTAYKP